mmetsp:Transcript_23750/g.62067  ORF Transcript_23750/g.62067 Transcript_23750/m.62067 type:complete len:247 (-) Transcript_23750:233-973(-)
MPAEIGQDPLERQRHVTLHRLEHVVGWERPVEIQLDLPRVARSFPRLVLCDVGVVILAALLLELAETLRQLSDRRYPHAAAEVDRDPEPSQELQLGRAREILEPVLPRLPAPLVVRERGHVANLFVKNERCIGTAFVDGARVPLGVEAQPVVLKHRLASCLVAQKGRPLAEQRVEAVAQCDRAVVVSRAARKHPRAARGQELQRQNHVGVTLELAERPPGAEPKDEEPAIRPCGTHDMLRLGRLEV